MNNHINTCDKKLKNLLIYIKIFIIIDLTEKMWMPKYSGDFKNLYGKKIIVTYGYEGEKNSNKTEGILTRIGKDANNVLSSVILDIKNTNNHNHNYISSNTICFNLISNVEIECDDVENVVKEVSENKLCLDISDIILDFSNKYIPL